MPDFVPMRVLHYLELEDRLARSGIGTATKQQRAALDTTDIEVSTSPRRHLPRLDDVDVVHCNTIGPGDLVLARWAKATGTPLVFNAHTTREDFCDSFRGSNLLSRPLGRYLRWLYSTADRVIVPSEHTRSLLDSYPVRAPIEVVSNGIDRDSLAGFEGFREEYRERFDLSGTVVFAVGNVFERKGLSTFCELAKRRGEDFAWFGTYDTGPQASATVRKWITDPPENVTFTGWIDDKRGAYGAGDVFCFPAKEENQGLVVLEAMACGKPVVLRDIPVFREFFTDGEDCLLCDSLPEFESALDRLADDFELRERLGENARETAAEHSLDRIGAELAGIYRDLAG